MMAFFGADGVPLLNRMLLNVALILFKINGVYFRVIDTEQCLISSCVAGQCIFGTLPCNLSSLST